MDIIRKRTLLWIVFSAILVSCILPRPAEAYLDPGTGGTIFGSIWALILPFITMAVVFIAAMIRPVRIYVMSFVAKIFGRSKEKATINDEQLAPDDLYNGGSSEETKDDDPTS